VGVRFGAGSCCNSSHFSDDNKSEKNMSDFEGEGVLSDEEIVTLSQTVTGAHEHLAMPSSPHRIPGVATIYQKHHLHAPADSAQGFGCTIAWITNLNEPPSSFLLPPHYCGLGAGSFPCRAIVNNKQYETRGLFISPVIHDLI